MLIEPEDASTGRKVLQRSVYASEESMARQEDSEEMPMRRLKTTPRMLPSARAYKICEGGRGEPKLDRSPAPKPPSDRISSGSWGSEARKQASGKALASTSLGDLPTL